MPLSSIARLPFRRQQLTPASAPVRIGLLGTAASCGIAAAMLVHLGLPAPVYRTVAVVVPDVGGARTEDASRQLADFALSRQVLRFAAADLIGKSGLEPIPGPLERFGLVRSEAEAGRAARLADQLAAAVHARTNGGSLLIGAEAPDALRAARIATSVALAFVAKRAEAVSTLQRTREAELASRIAGAQASAAAARKRFLALGGTDAGVVQARTVAAAAVTAAEERVSRLRAVLASGSPPISDDLPSSQAVVDLQNTFLDLKGKLAQALETLGERHTTVIELRSSMRRASADLAAGWTRQLRNAEADRDAARARAAALGDGSGVDDAKKQTALDEARRAKEVADSALLRAEAELDFLPDQPAFSLRTAAAVPTKAADGWFAPARAAAAILAGAVAFWLALALKGGAARLRQLAHAPATRDIASFGTAWTGRAWTGRSRKDDLKAESRRVAPVMAPLPVRVAPAAAPVGKPHASSVWTVPLRAGLAHDDQPAGWPVALTAAAPAPAIPALAPLSDWAEPALADAAPVVEEQEIRFFRDPLPESDAAENAATGTVDANDVGPIEAAVVPPANGTEAASVEEDRTEGTEAEQVEAESAEADVLAMLDELRAEDEAVRDLRYAFERILVGFARVTPRNGPIPALMVATDSTADGTADVALAVGEVAAGAGLRVLVVEASRTRPTLAAHAKLDGRPALVGMRDGLRIVLEAAGIEGLFLAPLFEERANLVAALARNAGAPVIEAIADTFDLLIIDGGAAATAAAAGWTADIFLCVGGNASIGESERFLEALGNPEGVFAGTVADATFVPPPERKPIIHVAPRLRLVASRPQPVLTAVAA